MFEKLKDKFIETSEDSPKTNNLDSQDPDEDKSDNIGAREKAVLALAKFAHDNKDVADLIIWLPLVCSLMLLLAGLILPGTYSVFTVILEFLLAVLAFFLNFLFVPEIDKKNIRKVDGSMKWPVFVAFLYAASLIFIVLSSRFHINVSFLAIPGFIIAMFATIGLFRTNLVTGILESIKEAKPFIERFGIKEFYPGDVVLCNSKTEYEKGAKDPRVILPLTDRFLHMLVIGATGTGKTSQILLPMFVQDIQNKNAGLIIIEPKGDFAMQGKFVAEHFGRDVKFFDPSMEGCPKFNPLSGPEEYVISTMTTTFRMNSQGSSAYFLDTDEKLVTKATQVLKRLDAYYGIDGEYANLINMSRLCQNSGGYGRELISKFLAIPAPTENEQSENEEIASWFLNDYFSERSKEYQDSSAVRSQLSKLVSNRFLREVLNPDVKKGEKNEIDFDKCLADGEVFCISTAQGQVGGALSSFLGYFLILQLESAVLRRPLPESSRIPCFLYIDEFQKYANTGFRDMLEQGRSYRVASILATQTMAAIGMSSGFNGKDFISIVESNTGTKVIFPRCASEDAKHYSEMFGKHIEKEESQTRTIKGFDPLSGGWKAPGHPQTAIREEEKEKPNFSQDDIMYRPSGEIVFRYTKHNNIQIPDVGLIEYIPKELKAELDEKIAVYVAENLKKTSLQEKQEIKAESESGFVFEDDEGVPDSDDVFDDLGGEEIELEPAEPEIEIDIATDDIFDEV